MKKITYILLAFTFIFSLNGFAQSDLSVHYLNYSNGEVIATDTIYTDFYLKNHGVANYHNGDTIYVSAKINGSYFGLNLVGNKTAIVLDDHFHSGDSLIRLTGYLIGSQALPFFPSSSTLEICIVVWGEGIASVDIAGGTFPSDSDPSDNTTCVTYDPSQLSIATQEKMIFSLFPNPATSEITFDVVKKGNYQLVVLNALGQKIIENAVFNETNSTINISSLTNEFYNYSILDENGHLIATGKFIKD
jgi:hypothetical protein